MPYISKFALSKGTLEIPADQVLPDGSYWHNPSGKAGWGTYVGKSHVHATREAAVAKGEKMRATKIASHEKSIAALKSLAI